MSGRAPLASIALVLLAITACGRGGPEPDRHPDWVIRSKVVFLADDLGSARSATPLAEFRMLFPYIAGDLYGAPTTGELNDAPIARDYSFAINLNRSEKALLASLEETQFSLPYLKIAPPEARLARLAPMAIEADGIDPIGRVEWVDPDTKRSLLLLYADRPAVITGRGVAGGRRLSYDIHFGAPGYVWAVRRTDSEGDTYTTTPKPARLLLAVTPLANDRPTVALPARTGIPVQ